MNSIRLLGATLGAVLLATCSEPGPGRDFTVTELPTDAQVSNPIPVTSAPAIRTPMQNVVYNATERTIVYVSLPEGAVPGGVRASVRRVGDEVPVVTTMWDGGFDPVAVRASETDSVEIVVTKVGGSTVHNKLPVRPKRPPKVVRTWPPRSKSDTPINASLIVVFSEPLDEKTVSPSSVKLYTGQQEVAGKVELLPGDGTTIAFTPNANMEPSSEYRLVISASVADREGETLGEEAVLGFTTGTTEVGPPTTIHLSPDSIVMVVGSVYQFTAKVFDEDGNMLVRRVMWSSMSPNVTMSQTGLAGARTTPSDIFSWPIVRIEARVGTLASSAFILVVDEPASLQVLPSSATIGVGDTLAVEVLALDYLQRRILVPLTVKNSNATAVAVAVPDLGAMQLTPFRTVKALAPGSARIVFRSGEREAATDITVSQELVPVGTVRVAPASAELMPQESMQLAAWLRDASGQLIFGARPVVWSTSNASIATVNTGGRVTAVANGSATITATIDGKTSSTSITVSAQPAAPTFIALAARQYQTCAVSAAADAYCWGLFHALNETKPLLVPTLLRGGLDVAQAVPGGTPFLLGHLCAGTGAGDVFCWNDHTSLPGRLSQTHKFSSLSLSEGGHSCGVATDGSAFCWGANQYGQIGDGTLQPRRDEPTAVIGGRRFTSVTAGRLHSCGVTTTGDAYCWGANKAPVLYSGRWTLSGSGDTTTAVLPTPTLVAGSLTFAQLSAGLWHTCGLTTAGKAYCWGNNTNGELGDGTLTNRSEPVAVATTLTFTAISVGITHTCAIASSAAAYCWGYGFSGQLGVDGSQSSIPVAVQGNLSFARIALGIDHSCGITTTGRLYCWGDAERLGDGSDVPRSMPTPVARPDHR